jgi:major type 1 subunit fimbrin (pilin)
MNSIKHIRFRASIVALSAIAGLGGSENSFASDGTITVNGTVKATTCSVTAQLGTTIPTSGATPNLTVTLPTISWQSIQATGASAGSTAFSIGVYGCGTTANTMAVNFETSNSMNSSGVITSTGGLAGNYLRLLNSNQSNPVVPGAPLATSSIASGGAGQTFYVQYYNGTGAALTSSNVGAVVGTLTYTINYT